MKDVLISVSSTSHKGRGGVVVVVGGGGGGSIGGGRGRRGDKRKPDPCIGDDDAQKVRIKINKRRQVLCTLIGVNCQCICSTI